MYNEIAKSGILFVNFCCSGLILHPNLYVKEMKNPNIQKVFGEMLQRARVLIYVNGFQLHVQVS
jgi:hypothetical protein